MKLTIEFDDYEVAILRKAKRDLEVAAKRSGKKPPTLRDVVKGAVRMGVHSVYGEDYISEDLLSSARFDELAGEPIDLSHKTQE